jgi:NDP-4-keto-2,6-dideoxyhexose 3-C-methyltransferase
MKIKECRICGNKQLIKIGSLGKIAISNFTEKPEVGKKYPLELVYCEECTLLQLAHNTPRHLLYRDYWYESHLNPVIVKDLKEIAEYGRGSHIDIGANDGTLLQHSKATVKVAIDPANIKPQGVDYWLQTYWEYVNFSGKGDIITAIACLYDLPDPNSFIRNILWHLKPDGVFIAQLMTLQPMIENNDVGNICHEHLEYYSYKSLVRLYEKNGLEIFKVEKNAINGGSYRLFSRHYQSGSIDYPEQTYGVKELQSFFARVEENKQMMAKFFLDGQNIYGYGASTKANTILQYYGNPKLKAIVDINPGKLGRYTIASKIPIIDTIPNDCEYLWVFPYGFLDYFKQKEKAYKGKWVTSIPEFKIC